MGILSRILGDDKIISSGLDLIDNSFYTNEEKAENKKAFLGLYTAFKVAQRYLALIFTIPYVLMVVVTFGASFFVDVSVQKEILTGDIGTIVGMITGFYFLGGTISGGFKI